MTVTHFPRLFSPLRLGPREARNRIVSTPHTTGFGVGGFPRDRWRAYEREKARGGAGTVMMFGSASVHPASTAAQAASCVASAARHQPVSVGSRTTPPRRSVSTAGL